MIRKRIQSVLLNVRQDFFCLKYTIVLVENKINFKGRRINKSESFTEFNIEVYVTCGSSMNACFV